MDLRALIIDHPRAADALALFAGAPLVLAYAPFEWRWVVFLPPALLMLLWLDASPGRAFRRGYLFGLGQFGLGVSWVYASIHFFGHAIAPLAAAITLGFVALVSLYPAILGALIARMRLSNPIVALVLVMPAAWVLFEWLRGWFLTGFPWLLLGHTQVDTPLGGFAPVLGVYGVSWVVALVSGLSALTLAASRPRHYLALPAVAVLFALGWLLQGQVWTQPQGAPIRAALVQGSIPQDQKWEVEQFVPTLKLYRDLTREHWDADLIVWPETAIPAYYREVEEVYLDPLRAEAEANNAGMVIGIFIYEDAARAVYNSVISLREEGSQYYKRHLVPFGEYLPLRGLLFWLSPYMEIPMSDLSRGSGKPLVRAAGQAIGVSICYEDAFGEEVIDALPEATLLVNVSNDAWFGGTVAPWQHLEIARMRALETGRYMLRATNTGVSAIIDERGALLGTTAQSKTEVLSLTVQPRSGMTPYAAWGNWAVVMLCALAVMGGLALNRLAGRERAAHAAVARRT